MKDYLFNSKRLGFRTWTDDDLPTMAAINADTEVMNYFPSTVNESDTHNWMKKQNADFEKYGYCYYAVDELSTSQLIGFIGLSYKEMDTDFSPCTDIGWRLAISYQGKGFATEGAKSCLAFGFNTLGLQEIAAMAPEINYASVHVMKKAGMKFHSFFNHPQLANYPHLEQCVLYKLSKNK